jgi:hypothetical protein
MVQQCPPNFIDNCLYITDEKACPTFYRVWGPDNYQTCAWMEGLCQEQSDCTIKIPKCPPNSTDSCKLVTDENACPLHHKVWNNGNKENYQSCAWIAGSCQELSDCNLTEEH